MELTKVVLPPEKFYLAVLRGNILFFLRDHGGERRKFLRREI